MYRHFYGLQEKPFNMTPDPKFLYLGSKHKEAFAHLFYGIKNRNGFVVITGEVGTGKTTLCRALLKQIGADTDVAVLFNPCLSPDELLEAVNADFGIGRRESSDGIPRSRHDLLNDLNNYLIEKRAEDRNVVLLIDESQLLSAEVLEHIRLLSNFETETEKLIQIVLVGQPELQAHLSLPKLRQLDQRVTARYNLPPLDAKETAEYVYHRLRKAGASKKIFTKTALDFVYKYTRGIPRQINVLCERALLAGYAAEQGEVDKALIKKAWRALEESKTSFAKSAPGPKRLVPLYIACSLVALAAVAAGTWHVARSTAGLPDVKIAGAAVADAGNVSASGPAVPENPDSTDSSSVDVNDSGVATESGAVEETATSQMGAASSPVPILMAKAGPVPPVARTVEETITEGIVPATEVDVGNVAKDSERGLGRDAIVEALLKETRLEQRVRVASVLLDSWGCDTSKLNGGLEGLKYAGDFFRVAREAGLRCMKDGMNLTRLKEFNLPFILELRMNGRFGSETRYLAVTKIEGNKCLSTSIPMEDGECFDFDEIADLWLGRAYVFWKDYENLGGLLAMGSKGLEVKRLHVLLSRAGYYKGSARPIFSSATQKSVVAFQRAHRLAQDGVVGDNTQIALYGISKGYKGPKLWAKAEEPDSELPDALRTPVKTEVITIGRGDDIS